MKVIVYSTPEDIKNHKLGVKVMLPGGGKHDYGMLNFGKKYHEVITKEIPKLAESFNEPLEFSAFIGGVNEAAPGAKRDPWKAAKKLEESLAYSVRTGNYSEVFGGKDENNVKFIPMYEDGKPVRNEDGKIKFVPIYGKEQKESFDFNSDYWKLSPEEYRAKMDEWRAGVGFAPMSGIGAREDYDPLNLSKSDRDYSDYESVFLKDGGLTMEEKEELINAMPPEARDAYRKLASNHRWVKDNSGNLIIDFDTGRGHNAKGKKHRFGQEAIEANRAKRKANFAKSQVEQFEKETSGIESQIQNAIKAAENNDSLNKAMGNRMNASNAKSEQLHKISKLNSGYKSFLSGIHAGLKNNPSVFGLNGPINISKDELRNMMPKEKYIELYMAGGNNAARNMLLQMVAGEKDAMDEQRIITNAVRGFGE